MLIIIKQKCRKLLRFAGIIANECEQTIERQRKHQLLRQFSQKKWKKKNCNRRKTHSSEWTQRNTANEKEKRPYRIAETTHKTFNWFIVFIFDLICTCLFALFIIPRKAVRSTHNLIQLIFLLCAITHNMNKKHTHVQRCSNWLFNGEFVAVANAKKAATSKNCP